MGGRFGQSEPMMNGVNLLYHRHHSSRGGANLGSLTFSQRPRLPPSRRNTLSGCGFRRAVSNVPPTMCAAGAMRVACTSSTVARQLNCGVTGHVVAGAEFPPIIGPCWQSGRRIGYARQPSNRATKTACLLRYSASRTSSLLNQSGSGLFSIASGI